MARARAASRSFEITPSESGQPWGDVLKPALETEGEWKKARGRHARESKALTREMREELRRNCSVGVAAV